jgi:hypothetical protein
MINLPKSSIISSTAGNASWDKEHHLHFEKPGSLRTIYRISCVASAFGHVRDIARVDGFGGRDKAIPQRDCTGPRAKVRWGSQWLTQKRRPPSQWPSHRPPNEKGRLFNLPTFLCTKFSWTQRVSIKWVWVNKQWPNETSNGQLVLIQNMIQRMHV